MKTECVESLKKGAQSSTAGFLTCFSPSLGAEEHLEEKGAKVFPLKIKV